MARMATRHLDALLAVALAVALQLQLALADGAEATPVAVLGGLALTLPLAWRRRAPLGVVLAFAAAAAAQGALGGGLYAGEPPLLAAIVAGGVAFYSLGAHAADRSARLGLAAGIAGLWATVLVSGDPDVQSFALAGGIVAAAPWLAGRARALREAALERERDQRAQVAAAEERQRIARELHDVVAHGVVLMVLQAQGAGRILDHDPERARAALAAIEETGQAALSDIRRSLGLLRDGGESAERAPQPRLADLDALVADMRRAGLDVELRVEGPRRALANDVDRSAYRIVQEALTNTVKHAGLVPTRVTLRYAPADLELEIADDGPAPREGTDRAGQGLAGMRERVRLHGGELHAAPANGRGFVVRARIPLGA